MSTEIILLRPRPYALASGRLLLLPLLPHKPPTTPLPSEIWREIAVKVFDCDGNDNTRCRGMSNGDRVALLTVCKRLKEIALPLFYAKIYISKVSSLQRFATCIFDADQKWDSIRRIPYSTPGRWVQDLDLSGLAFTSQSEVFLLDSFLTELFPLLPFLVQFALNPAFVLSRRAIQALAGSDCSYHLRRLEGISYSPDTPLFDSHDALVQLVKCCPNLEKLEIIGPGLDPTDFNFSASGDDKKEMLPPSVEPPSLLRLHTLTLLSIHSSPLMYILLHTPLPTLRTLTLTPYDDIPYPASLVSEFITAHGHSLRSLLLSTPKSWPTRLHPSPSTLLTTCPNLSHLSLENPLPNLSMPLCSSPLERHPLRTLSIPRPKADYWRTFEGYLPHLPQLVAVRARDVRWLRRGMNLHAQGAGVQGEMREWRRRLLRKGINVLDADWNECE